MKKILIIAGGTGGHIFPALAVAQQLHDQGWQIQWLGAVGRLEEKLVTPRFPIKLLPIQSLRGKGWRAWIQSPWRLLRSLFLSWRVIRTFAPDVVLGMGGFVTGPAGIAAWVERIPLVIHESNTMLGLTNRYLFRVASRCLQGFPDTFPAKLASPKKIILTTGNPVQRDIQMLPAPQIRFQQHSGPLRILVLGGSQGAHFINQLLMDWYKEQELSGTKINVLIWHQTGEQDFATVEACYKMHPCIAKVEPFIQNMAAAYAWADGVVARAGALTVSELMVAGLGGILIPFPYAADNHQYYNARYLESAGAALLLPESKATVENLRRSIESWSLQRQLLQQMGEKAHGLAQREATEQVTLACSNVALNKI